MGILCAGGLIGRHENPRPRRQRRQPLSRQDVPELSSAGGQLRLRMRERSWLRADSVQRSGDPGAPAGRCSLREEVDLRVHLRPLMKEEANMIEGRALLGVSLMALVTIAAGCGDASRATATPPAPVVKVEPVVERDVPISVEYVGTLVGYINAQIRARVAGHLVSQNYSEGSPVKAGDLLFQVDPRPFQTAADQADAKLNLAESQLSQAKAQVSASQAQVEQAIAKVAQDEAQVKRAEATQRQTELDVNRYTPLAQRGSVSQQELDNAVQ